MKTEIIVILDRSGSMHSIATDVVGGFNSFVKDQQDQPGEARLTLVQFDTAYELDYVAYNINDVPTLEFTPRGGTALYDALGRTLVEQGARISKEKWADLVIVNIITDGEENSSNKFTQEAVKILTTSYEESGWEFIFLAANQDAFAAAKNYGMSGKLAGNFEANSMGATTMYETTSATMRSLRSGEKLTGLVSKD